MVSRQSAVPGHQTNSELLLKDHISMVKFESDDDPDFGTVVSHLNSFMSKLVHKQARTSRRPEQDEQSHPRDIPRPPVAQLDALSISGSSNSGSSVYSFSTAPRESPQASPSPPRPSPNIGQHSPGSVSEHYGQQGLSPGALQAKIAQAAAHLARFNRSKVERRPLEALPAIQTAATAYRELAELDSATYSATATKVYKEAALLLMKLSRHDDAVSAMECAVQFARQATPPRSYLSSVLRLYGQSLLNCGRCGQALKAVTEALEIPQSHAEDPDASYLDYPDLAELLFNIAQVCDTQQDWRVGLAAIEHCCHVLQKLVTTQASHFTSKLADSLDLRHRILSKLSQDQEALNVAKQGLAVRKDIQSHFEHSQQVEGSLAGTYLRAYSSLFKLKQYEQALKYVAHAVGILVRLKGLPEYARMYDGAIAERARCEQMNLTENVSSHIVNPLPSSAFNPQAEQPESVTIGPSRPSVISRRGLSADYPGPDPMLGSRSSTGPYQRHPAKDGYIYLNPQKPAESPFAPYSFSNGYTVQSPRRGDDDTEFPDYPEYPGETSSRW